MSFYTEMLLYERFCITTLTTMVNIVSENTYNSTILDYKELLLVWQASWLVLHVFLQASWFLKKSDNLQYNTLVC